MSVCSVPPQESSYPKRAGTPRGRGSALGRQLGGRGRENTVTGMETVRDVSGSTWRLESSPRCAAVAAPSLPVWPPAGVLLPPSVPSTGVVLPPPARACVMLPPSARRRRAPAILPLAPCSCHPSAVALGGQGRRGPRVEVGQLPLLAALMPPAPRCGPPTFRQ